MNEVKKIGYQTQMSRKQGKEGVCNKTRFIMRPCCDSGAVGLLFTCVRVMADDEGSVY